MPTDGPCIRVGVQADPTGGDAWTSLAQRVEGLGFDALLVADHPGSGPAPFVALGAAAGVTSRIALGTYVANAGVWEPIALASAVATLDVVSDGRARLGVGAGHTPSEWLMRGIPHPSPGARVDRMIELVDATRRLLAGEEVTVRGEHVTLERARLDEPPRVRDAVPLLIGGAGDRLLRYAATHADIVGLSGLGRTLEDGHRHDTRWAEEDINRQIDLVRRAADAAGRRSELEALVQRVELTDEPESWAAEMAGRVPSLTPEQVLSAPFVWVGSAAEIAARLQGFRERWGLARYVVREDAVDAAREVLDVLA